MNSKLMEMSGYTYGAYKFNLTDQCLIVTYPKSKDPLSAAIEQNVTVVYLEDLGLFRCTHGESAMFFLLGQYGPSEFCSILCTEHDQFIQALEANELVRVIDKEVVRAPELGKDSGLIEFSHAISFRYDRDPGSGESGWDPEWSVDINVFRGKLLLYKFPRSIFIDGAMNSSDEPANVDLSSVPPRNTHIIFLDPWVKNEQYAKQFYKKKYQKGSYRGCVIAIVIIIIAVYLLNWLL